ncbi:MAG: MBL fold metallo-hydrolase [Anaerolineales bacterium]
MALQHSAYFDAVIRLDLARSLAGHGRYWTTAYLVDDLLIDSGCAYSAPELLAFLHSCPPRTLFNTHSHEDHIGGNGVLQRAFPALQIYAHPLTLSVLADPHRRQPLHPYRRVMWGWPQAATGRPVKDGDLIHAGRLTFRVIATPGHAPDHLSLYQPERGWLFSGDLFVGGRERALLAEADIWSIIVSLKKIAALELACLFPGSARVRENPQAELQEKIAYLEEMGAQVLKLHSKGWSEAAIARALFGGPMFIEFFTLGHFSRRNLVRSYLRKEGIDATVSPPASAT